jgi:hypothetical protein
MTEKIRQADWKEFFDRISQDFLDWEISVQILSQNSGAQMLSEGLPFNGLTYENRHGHGVMELNVGSGSRNHQTHNIYEPRSVAFESHGPGGTLDIEDDSGTKTLVNFLHPMPFLVEYVKSELLTRG